MSEISVKCPKCGIENAPGPSGRCPACGESIAAAVSAPTSGYLACGSCLLEVSSDAGPCPRCGESLAGAKWLPRIPPSQTSWTPMGVVGMFLLVAGIIGCVGFLGYDTAPSGTHNVGLLNEKSSSITFFSALAIVGAVLTASPHARKVRT